MGYYCYNMFIPVITLFFSSKVLFDFRGHPTAVGRGAIGSTSCGFWGLVYEVVGGWKYWKVNGNDAGK